MSTIISGTNGVTFPDSTSMQTGQQACKAWVNFNGTGTVAIRQSFNVSSITDNGTGDYTVNFTNAMSASDHSFALSFNNQLSNIGSNLKYVGTGTNYLRVQKYENNSLTDCAYVAVTIFSN